MTHFGRWLLVGTFGLGSVALTARADENGAKRSEHTMTLDQLPTAARSTLVQEAHGKQLRELRSVMKNGETVYEGEYVVGTTGHEIEVNADGKVLKRSKHDESKENEENEQ